MGVARVTSVAALAVAIAACAAPMEGVPPSPPVASPSAPVAMPTQPTRTAPTPPAAGGPISAERVQAIVVDPSGFDWSPAIGTSAAHEARSQVRGTYGGSVDPAACLGVLQGRRLALDTDKEDSAGGEDAVVALGRSTAPGPAPEAIRVRVTPDAAAATAVVDQIVAAARACPGYHYVPDTHYRESVGAVRVAAATAGGAEAARIVFTDRAEYLDGDRTSRWRGEYLGGYLYAVGNVVVWLEFDLRDSEPSQAVVDAFAADVAAGLAR